MEIHKGKIGNALTSVAPDHVVATAEDIYDEALELYQSEINRFATSFPSAEILNDYLARIVKNEQDIQNIINDLKWK